MPQWDHKPARITGGEDRASTVCQYNTKSIAAANPVQGRSSGVLGLSKASRRTLSRAWALEGMIPLMFPTCHCATAEENTMGGHNSCGPDVRQYPYAPTKTGTSETGCKAACPCRDAMKSYAEELTQDCRPFTRFPASCPSFDQTQSLILHCLTVWLTFFSATMFTA